MIDVQLVPAGALLEQQRSALWRILVEVDGEFIPPLSSRQSTTTKDLQPAPAAAEGPHAYFDRLLQQTSLIATADGALVGVLSFIPHHEEDLLQDWCPASYVSTIAVERSRRRAGVARALYHAVLHLPEQVAAPFVATRTWGTNDAHLVLLAALGFREVARLCNDRGEGIDTVYLARRAAEDQQ